MHLEWYTAGPPIQHPFTLHLPTTPSTTHQCNTRTPPYLFRVVKPNVKRSPANR
ncbi:hypothetical protein T06_13949 [Trichinella sp. T6]|nr:hypothetical protein T06_13949 [Trichinella sp. T6]